MRDHNTIMELCGALEVSRSGYYKSTYTEPSERLKENQQIIHAMKKRYMGNASRTPAEVPEYP